MTMQTIEYKSHYIHIGSAKNNDDVTMTIIHPTRGNIAGAAFSLHSAKMHITKCVKAFNLMYGKAA